MESYSTVALFMKILTSKNTLHFVTVLAAGCSASYWAVAATHYLLPLLWLCFFSMDSRKGAQGI